MFEHLPHEGQHSLSPLDQTLDQKQDIVFKADLTWLSNVNEDLLEFFFNLILTIHHVSVIFNTNAQNSAAFVKYDARLICCNTTLLRLLLFQNPCNCGVKKGEDSWTYKIFRKKFDKIVHEVIKVDESDRIKKSHKLLDNVIQKELEPWCDIMISDDNRYSVDATSGDDLIYPFLVTDTFDQELHRLLESIRVICEQDVSVVSKQKTESTF